MQQKTVTICNRSQGSFSTQFKIPDEQWQFRLCVSLRSLQNESNCSTRHLYRVVNCLQPFFSHQVPRNLGMADPLLQARAAVTVEQLVACVQPECSNPHIWTTDTMPQSCPRCNQPLRNSDGDVESVYFFPLRPRLQALMNTARYRHMLQYEHTRKKNPLFFTDIYDTPGTYSHHKLVFACCSPF